MNLENPFQVRIFYDSIFLGQRTAREKKKKRKKKKVGQQREDRERISKDKPWEKSLNAHSCNT